MPILLRALLEPAIALRDSVSDGELVSDPDRHIKLEEKFMEHSVVRRTIDTLNIFATNKLEEFQASSDEIKLNR